MIPQTCWLNVKGKERAVGKGMGERDMGGAITGDGEGTKEEKEGDRHPPHVRSPPTFQPWLCLCWVRENPELLFCWQCPFLGFAVAPSSSTPLPTPRILDTLLLMR